MPTDPSDLGIDCHFGRTAAVGRWFGRIGRQQRSRGHGQPYRPAS
jgi:hypothetical protein